MKRLTVASLFFVACDGSTVRGKDAAFDQQTVDSGPCTDANDCCPDDAQVAFCGRCCGAGEQCFYPSTIPAQPAMCGTCTTMICGSKPGTCCHPGLVCARPAEGICCLQKTICVNDKGRCCNGNETCVGGKTCCLDSELCDGGATCCADGG